MNKYVTWKRCALAALVGLTGLIVSIGFVSPADAQMLSLDLGEGGGDATARIVQLIILITVLSLAPSILVMVTSFTRIVIVLAFVRTAMGTPQAPPNQVLISLAMFLTIFVMMPVFEESYDSGIRPLMENQIDEFEAFERASEPFRGFMMGLVREKDLMLFVNLAEITDEEIDEGMPLRALVPAFMISELRRAFE
ncbi:MAG: flagellar type III secretion system pore protein FliP, partial [Rhodospirillales bacterium]|nr:flagellar type III secretion system pore protein FliP [Rhodospirillales bacterium]